MAEKLVVLWTSGDPEVAEHMAFMYTLNAMKRGWFQDVTFVVWGPSAALLARDEELRRSIGEMKHEGVRLEACLRCAENYGVVEKLEELGIDVRLMGVPLSDYLKEGRRVLTV